MGRLLVLGLDSPEKNRELVATVRKHFPHLRILARAYDWWDAHELLEAAGSGIETLERQLPADLEDAGETRDTGWDVESLREEVRKKAPGS